MKRRARAISAREIAVEENALMDFQFAVIDALNRKGLTQNDLAEMSGVSKARISQLLSSEANPTLKVVARTLDSLDLCFKVECKNDEPELEETFFVDVSGGRETWNVRRRDREIERFFVLNSCDQVANENCSELLEVA